MRALEYIDDYIEKIDGEEIIEDESMYKWTRRDYATNLLLRAALMVKFMALEPTPKLIKKKQVRLLRERLDAIEEMIDEEVI